MDKKQAIAIAKTYKSVVAKQIPLKAVYLFGSYNKGNHTDESDIAVIVARRSDNYFEDTPLLWKLGRQVKYPSNPYRQQMILQR